MFLASAERFLLSVDHLLLAPYFPLSVLEKQRTGVHRIRLA